MWVSVCHLHQPVSKSSLSDCNGERVKAVDCCVPLPLCPGRARCFRQMWARSSLAAGPLLLGTTSPFLGPWHLEARPRQARQCFIGHMNFGIFRLNNRNSSPKLLTLLSWHSLRKVSQCECREKKRTSDQVTVLGPWCDALVLSPNSSYSVSSGYSVSFVKWVHWLKCLWGLLSEMNQPSNGLYKHCYVIFFPEERGANV